MNTTRSVLNLLSEQTNLDTVTAPGVYRQRVGLPTPALPVTMIGTHTVSRVAAEQGAIWQLTLQRFAAEVGKSLAEVGKVVERITEAWQQAGLVAENLPTEPRERALAAKRNRGTGPATPKAWHKR